MRILLKLSPYVWVFFIAFPIWLLLKYGHEEWFSRELRVFLFLFPPILSAVWQLSVNDFLNHELKEKNAKDHRWILGLGIVYILLVLLFGIIDYSTNIYIPIIMGTNWSVFIIQALSIPFVILLVFRTRRYMYARSIWWLIIEMLFPIIGILSLSSALQMEKMELEEEKTEVGNIEN